MDNLYCYWLLPEPDGYDSFVTGQKNKAAIDWLVGPEDSSMLASIHNAGRCSKVSEGKQAEVPVCSVAN